MYAELEKTGPIGYCGENISRLEQTVVKPVVAHVDS